MQGGYILSFLFFILFHTFGKSIVYKNNDRHIVPPALLPPFRIGKPRTGKRIVNRYGRDRDGPNGGHRFRDWLSGFDSRTRTMDSSIGRATGFQPVCRGFDSHSKEGLTILPHSDGPEKGKTLRPARAGMVPPGKKTRTALRDARGSLISVVANVWRRQG